MPHWLESLIELATQFTGRGGACEVILVWHSLAGMLWCGLAFVVWSKQKRLPSRKESLLKWAFFAGLVLEFSILVVKAICTTGEGNAIFIRGMLPPAETVLRISVILFVVSGFLRYSLKKEKLATTYLKASLGVVAVCYLATFWWCWQSASQPDFEFSNSWAKQLFYVSLCVMLTLPAVWIWQEQKNWSRKWTRTMIPLICFWLFGVVAIPIVAVSEKSTDPFVVISRGFYLLGIVLAGFVYFRELIATLGTEALQQRVWKERFEAFMDNSPFIAWVKNSKGEHQYLSEPYALQIGIPVTEWEGKTDYDLWPKEVAQSHREMDQVVLESGEPFVFESTHPLPSGEVKHWYVVKFPFSIEEGREVFIGGIGLDVTDKTIAEIERDQFFETSSELMCINDREMKFKRVNHAFSDILGYDPEELLAKPFRELVHPDDRMMMDTAFGRAGIASKVIDFEVRFRCKDGSYRRVDWTTPTQDPDSKIDAEAIFVVGRDVTERRALEKRLLKVADDEQKRIAHDLHDGLGQELTGLAMMADSLALNLKNKLLPEGELAEKIAVQLEASLQLTRSLAMGLRPVEIDSSGLKSALSQLADRTNQRYKFGCSFSSKGDVDLLDAESATQLYRIAQEAVTNAARHAKPDCVEIRLEYSEGFLELAVVDDGVGIQNLDRSQAGIGLKSMEYRSDIIGGNLQMKSMDKGGTLITCRIPMK